MYNHATIKECLRGLIGFESSYNEDHAAIDADLLSSTSGIYINTLHPLLTYENILVTAEHFSQTVVRAHSLSVTYKTGDVVKEGSNVYQSLVDANINFLPSVNPSKWRTTNLLSAYLRRMYDASSIKLFQQLFTEKKMNEVAKSLLQNVHLFSGVGNLSNRITKVSGRRVGYKITLEESDTIAILSHIGLQLDTIQNPVEIYLHHTSSSEPIKVFSIDHTKSIQFEWHEIAAEILDYMGDHAGGAYYISYNEDDITGNAIKKDISFSGDSNCGSCTDAVVNSNLYNKWSKFVSIQPFYVLDNPADNLLWDEEDEVYVDNTTWGLNLQMSVQCDVSRLICRSKNVLTDALAKQLTVDMLNEMTYSTRDNQLKIKLGQLAAVALDNGENGQHGEAKKLREAIKALSFDFSDMSSMCSPCNDTRRPKLKTMWT